LLSLTDAFTGPGLFFKEIEASGTILVKKKASATP
jgi:hypothetical protein